MPELVLEDVSKSYGPVQAVKNISLHIQDQEYISILGPSGCGKTTTLRIIAGLTSVDSGNVIIGGKNVTHLPPHQRGIGFVFQHYEIFPNMDVWENVSFGPKSQGWDIDKVEKVTWEALSMMDIEDKADLFPGELPAPDLQRIGIARALATGAELLLLDEPLGSLDLKIREESQHELRSLVKDLKLTAIHVTHDQHEAMAISDRIIVMKRGEILQVGTPRDLYYKPVRPFVANFIGEANFLLARITEINEESIRLKSRQGFKLEIKNSHNDFNTGSRAVIAFRKEHVSLHKGHLSGINNLHGEITFNAFLGIINRIGVRMIGGEDLEIISPGNPSNPFVTGDPITIKLDPREIMVYNYPPESLEEELSI